VKQRLNVQPGFSRPDATQDFEPAFNENCKLQNQKGDEIPGGTAFCLFDF
jgi:hypothetical protein